MDRDRKKKPRRERRSSEPAPAVPEMGEDYEDILTATADLCKRAGARSVEIGYLHEGVPVEEADWYAHAQYRGARFTVEHHRGPVDAAFALAVRVMTGARCRCGKLVALSEDGAVAYSKATLANGLGDWSAEDAAAAGQCRWQRRGPRWEPSCDAEPLKTPDAR